MIAKVIAVILCSVGTFFFIIGTTGLLRLPDVFTRLHSSTKCDTMGAGSILIGLAVYSGVSWDVLKLLIVLGFLFISSATTGHAIGRSAVKQGIAPWRKEDGEGQ
jgi:multicomponent Na+:H+ antiporter subunit G